MEPPARRVVVIGGYGNFGARICRALAEDAHIEVVAAGRSPRRGGAALDVDARDFDAKLAALSPHTVIHCAGPFQAQDYRVARAAIAAGSHYIDLADGRAFVAGFEAALDAQAKARDVAAIAGASTLPALSSAVVDALAPRFATIDAIEIAIAPGQRAPRGEATLKAVMSYAGRPFKWLKGGQWTDAWGWQELRALRIGDAGLRFAAACDVPDLALFPSRYPTARTIAFRAALELKAQHVALWLAAGLRRIGVPLPLERWAPALERAARALDRLGSETGGMLVAVAGRRADGRSLTLEWHLTARSSHGPEIPCMAAILMTRKLAAGEPVRAGAYPCMGLITLRAFEAEFARWDIAWRIEERAA